MYELLIYSLKNKFFDKNPIRKSGRLCFPICFIRKFGYGHYCWKFRAFRIVKMSIIC